MIMPGGALPVNTFTILGLGVFEARCQNNAVRKFLIIKMTHALANRVVKTTGNPDISIDFSRGADFLQLSEKITTDELAMDNFYGRNWIRASRYKDMSVHHWYLDIMS